MKFEINGKNIEVTQAIKDAVSEELNRLDKYFNHSDVNAHVVVRTYSVGQKVEVTIFSDNKLMVRQEELHTDLYAAISLVGKSLEKQIRKIKDRITKQSKEGETISKYLVMDEISELEEETVKVIKRKKLENKPMTEEEALLQFEVVGHDFFVFDDFEVNCTKILYKRADGNYGIIELD